MNPPRPSRLYQPLTVGEDIRINYLDPDIHRRRARSRTFIGKIMEMGEISILTLVLFGGLLIFFNFPSYLAQVNFWFSTMHGQAQNKEALLNDLTSSKVFIPLAEKAVVESTTEDVPPLKSSITPPDNRIIIPKIGKNVPIQEVAVQNLVSENWEALEQDIQKGLEGGVVHYPGTAQPGEDGNVFITGHSSYYLWSPGAYKDVFALLPNLEVGDKIILYYNQKQYDYIIQEKKTVAPTEVNVLQQGGKKQLTLMTCVPVGTNLNRLILVGEEVDN